jgi:peptidylprolyl isomerase
MRHWIVIPALAALAWAAAAPGLRAATAPKAPVMAQADFRAVDPENALVVDTSKGRVIVEMYPEVAPLAVARIKELARAKFYDGLTFHRVIEDFMAQGGDPKGDGTGGSDRPDVAAEFSMKRGGDTPFVLVDSNAGMDEGFIKALPMHSQNGDLMVMTADGKVSAWPVWCQGVAGMARAGAPNSANSQYFLMSGYNAPLERNYTAWGAVLVGLDVVRSLKLGEPPTNPDKMLTVRVLADLPAASQPKLTVLDSRSASFKALVDYDHTQHGGSFSICDVQLPVRVQ